MRLNEEETSSAVILIDIMRYFANRTLHILQTENFTNKHWTLDSIHFLIFVRICNPVCICSFETKSSSSQYISLNPFRSVPIIPIIRLGEKVLIQRAKETINRLSNDYIIDDVFVETTIKITKYVPRKCSTVTKLVYSGKLRPDEMHYLWVKRCITMRMDRINMQK